MALLSTFYPNEYMKSAYKTGCFWQSKKPWNALFVRLSRLLVEEGGFEPPKASPTDLQSVPFGRSGTLPYWSWWTDSNPWPADYKSAALPTELHQHFLSFLTTCTLYHNPTKLSRGFEKIFFEKINIFSFYM